MKVLNKLGKKMKSPKEVSGYDMQYVMQFKNMFPLATVADFIRYNQNCKEPHMAWEKYEELRKCNS